MMNGIRFGCSMYSGGKISDTVWEDLNFGILSAGGPIATRPDDVKIGDVYYKEFTSSNNQLCADQREVPHTFKLSSKMYPHIHIFLKNGESAGTTGVTFTMYWSIRTEGGVNSGSLNLSATSAVLSGNANLIDIYDATGFDGPATLDGQISIVLARTAGDAGDVIPTTYGLHYEIDAMGSDTATVKFNGD